MAGVIAVEVSIIGASVVNGVVVSASMADTSRLLVVEVVVAVHIAAVDPGYNDDPCEMENFPM